MTNDRTSIFVGRPTEDLAISVNSTHRSVEESYREAERLGKSGVDCTLTYPNCIESPLKSFTEILFPQGNEEKSWRKVAKQHVPSFQPSVRHRSQISISPLFKTQYMYVPDRNSYINEPLLFRQINWQLYCHVILNDKSVIK